MSRIQNDILAKHVTGRIEFSNFDGAIVFNSQQRWELFEQDLMSFIACQFEGERYATHQVYQPSAKDWSFEGGVKINGTDQH